MKKKICYVITLSSTLRAFFLPQLEYLSNNGYDITVVCNDTAELKEALKEKGIRLIDLSFPRGPQFVKSVKSIFQLLKIFSTEQFDLIQYSTPNASLYGAVAAAFVGTKVRNYHCMGFRYLGFSGIKGALFKLIEKTTCALSTHIECVSESNRKLGIAEGLFPEEKAVVVYHGSTGGVDLKRFDYAKRDEYREKHRRECGYSEEDVVFGFVGRITRDKGICELFEAFSRITTEHKNVKLSLIGTVENDDFGIPEELMDAAKTNGNIQFLGRRMNIEEYYPMMDVLVLPSYREGFGNVVIEAEAMGTPVLVTAIPGPLDTMIPNETGLCCRVKDAEDLKEKMEVLIENPKLRKQLSQKAREYASSHFDSEQLCHMILERKRKLLEGGNELCRT